MTSVAAKFEETPYFFAFPAALRSYEAATVSLEAKLFLLLQKGKQEKSNSNCLCRIPW